LNFIIDHLPDYGGFGVAVHKDKKHIPLMGLPAYFWACSLPKS